MTIFVLDPVPKYLHKDVAKQLMKYENLYAEQVGFIGRSYSQPDMIRLDMMGGEFCGNAARSLGAFLVYNKYCNFKQEDDKYNLQLECSGLQNSITCEVTNTDRNNVFMSKVNMPIPKNISKDNLKVNDMCYLAIRVDFPGITHFIVDDEQVKNREALFNYVKDYMSKLNSNYEAFGIMFYNYRTNYLTPLVYVKSTNSLFWERSCASGTSALGVALAYKCNNSLELVVKQPGGELMVSVERSDNKIKYISINGKVEIIAEGIAYI